MAAADTVKVMARICGGLHHVGSGFAVAPDEVVTNAHVVAGAQAVSVTAPSGGQAMADLVLFDPNRDVAVLRVSGLGLKPLPLSTIIAGRGAFGVGYPHGGPELTVGGILQHVAEMTVPNIYGNALVERQVLEVAATLQHGNSGGPVLDGRGEVIGMVFGSTVDDPEIGLAVTVNEFSADLRAARSSTQTVSAGPCL